LALAVLLTTPQQRQAVTAVLVLSGLFRWLVEVVAAGQLPARILARLVVVAVVVVGVVVQTPLVKAVVLAQRIKGLLVAQRNFLGQRYLSEAAVVGVALRKLGVLVAQPFRLVAMAGMVWLVPLRGQP
jgi:hypothetical protein